MSGLHEGPRAQGDFSLPVSATCAALLLPSGPLDRVVLGLSTVFCVLQEKQAGSVWDEPSGGGQGDAPEPVSRAALGSPHPLCPSWEQETSTCGWGPGRPETDDAATPAPAAVTAGH